MVYSSEGLWMELINEVIGAAKDEEAEQYIPGGIPVGSGRRAGKQ